MTIFTPAIPQSGLAGWRLLQATYDRQVESFSRSPQINNDRAYLVDRLSEPIALDSFLDDRRLLRISLTAVGLPGEEWKRGFIEKVLSEASDPESTFLARLNNQRYSEFSEIFTVTNGQIALSPAAVADIADRFETAAFVAAVGEVDNNMRLSLNYLSNIGRHVDGSSSEEAILFRLLGDVPVRTVLERALNLPTETQQLPIERQAELLKTRLQSVLGVQNIQDISNAQSVERVLQRFHAIEAISTGPSPLTPGAAALSLFTGVGASGAQNLFLSRFI